MVDIATVKELSRGLREGLKRSQELTDTMIETLSSFHQCLSISFGNSSETSKVPRRCSTFNSLLDDEPQNPPTHDDQDNQLLVKTHNARRAHENIDDTLKDVETIIDYFDNCQQVELNITDDIAMDFDNYLNTIDHLQKASKFFTANNWLKGSYEALHRAENLLQISMLKLEEFLKELITENSIIISPPVLHKHLNTYSSKSVVFVSSDDMWKPILDTQDSQVNPAYESGSMPILVAPGSIPCMHEIAMRMISVGHEQKCLEAYRDVRSPILDHMLRKLGFESLSADEAKGVAFESLEPRMAQWPKHLYLCVKVLFPAEKSVCDEVFYNLGTCNTQCFVETIKGVMGVVMEFAENIVINKKASEKLFPVLKMYKAMHNCLPEVNKILDGKEAAPLLHKFGDSLHKFSQFACDVFHESERIVFKDGPSKMLMRDGTVHPLTSHVLNYLKLLIDHQGTLECLVSDLEGQKVSLQLGDKISKILVTLLTHLEANSKQYKESALAQLFLMNNVQQIIKNIKRSKTNLLLGDDWLTEHESMVQIHASGYHHATWDRILDCLNTHNIVNDGQGLVPKVVMKERFKAFNQFIEDLHHRQSQWTVPDMELKNALKKAILETILPPYSAFLRRFSGVLEGSKNPAKYLKFSVEDLRT